MGEELGAILFAYAILKKKKKKIYNNWVAQKGGDPGRLEVAELLSSMVPCAVRLQM